MKSHCRILLTSAFLILLSIGQSALADTKLSLKELNVTIESESATRTNLQIKTLGNKQADVSVFLIENPTRVVVDVSNFPSDIAKMIALDNPLFKKVRIGLHRDKTRIVLDSKLKHDYSLEVSQDGSGNYLIEISSENASSNSREPLHKEPLHKEPLHKEVEPKAPSTAPPPFQTPPVASSPNIEKSPLPSPEPSQSPSTSLPPSPKPSPSSTPTPSSSPSTSPLGTTTTPPSINIPSDPETLQQEPIESVEQKIKSTLIEGPRDIGSQPQVPTSHDGPVLKSIAFQTTVERTQSSIVVNVDPLPEYTLNEVGLGHYRLEIYGTTLNGDYLTLPQFPPTSFTGFKYFSASQGGSNSYIDIFTERSTSLSAYVSSNKIWIRVE